MQKFIIVFFFPVLVFSQIVDFNLEASWSISDIQDFYLWSNLPSYVGEINYAVDAYSVTYMTPNENDSLVLASGVVFLPVDPNCSMPVLSWQHGTVVADEGAPSQSITTWYSSTQTIGFISASHGYIVFMSDYLGLGYGDGFHNYCHSDTEASAVIDLIIAGKEFASQQGVQANDQLFLMGYSQGGHSTMATVKEIEANWNNTLSITASCPMAGPYSMSDAQAEMITTVYPNPGYFPYVIFSYDNVYGNVYNDVSDILKPGYADLYDMYSSGLYSMTDINDTIRFIAEDMYGIDQANLTPLDMIQEDYYLAYQGDPDHPFQIALEDNDLINFIPNSSMQIIHCSGDNDVTYENAVMAYEAFASAEDVSLIDGGNYDHGQCSSMSIIAAKLFFDTKANFCNSVHVFESTQSNHVINVFDLLGRPVTDSKQNSLMIEMYQDGSVKKTMVRF